MLLLFLVFVFFLCRWCDPFGAILISVVIIGRWSSIIFEQIKKIVGYTAPPDFINKVRFYLISWTIVANVNYQLDTEPWQHAINISGIDLETQESEYCISIPYHVELSTSRMV